MEFETNCPAGEALEVEGVPACRCRIEHNTLTATTDPRSLGAWCFGDYTTCPTWRERREHELANRGREHEAEIASGV